MSRERVPGNGPEPPPEDWQDPGSGPGCHECWDPATLFFWHEDHEWAAAYCGDCVKFFSGLKFGWKPMTVDEYVVLELLGS